MIRTIRETHSAPESIQSILELAGGRNRFGGPNFRAAWSTEEPCRHRWVIERWVAPERFGTPASWYASEQKELGPFPYKGSYEHCFTVETPEREFVQLTATLAERIALTIRKGDDYTSAEKRAAIMRRVAKEEQDYDQYTIDVLNNDPKFSGQPHVVVP